MSHKKVNHLCWNSCSSLEPGHTRCFSMNAAALLGIKAELGKLRHKGALATEQFQLLKARTKDGTVKEKLLALLNQAWALRCDGTLDEGEYAEDIRTVISEMPSPSGVARCPRLRHWLRKHNLCHQRLLLLRPERQKQVGGKTALLRRLPRARQTS